MLVRCTIFKVEQLTSLHCPIQNISNYHYPLALGFNDRSCGTKITKFFIVIKLYVSCPMYINCVGTRLKIPANDRRTMEPVCLIPVVKLEARAVIVIVCGIVISVTIIQTLSSLLWSLYSSLPIPSTPCL